MTTHAIERKLSALALLAATGLVLLLASAARGELDRSPAVVYDNFNAFCKTAFTAQSEPLFYQTFGEDLTFRDDGAWQHVSRNSAAIAFETNLPASSRVEYGKTAAYGQSTEAAERNFFLHLHHLAGLEPGTTYHYRILAIDERGHEAVTEDRTLTTLAVGEGQSLAPAQDAATPIVIDQPGTYILTQDIHADQTGIVITARDVTLDLNGHTILYNRKPMDPQLPSGSPMTWWEQSPYGVKVDGNRNNRSNIRVVNGHIIQGEGGDGGSANQRGCAPVGLTNGTTGELAGLTLTWHGNQVGGVDFNYGASGMSMHHNTLRDMGTELVNRHQAVRALARGGKMHHNLITRARQRGIEADRGGSEIYRNEIYIDSWTTNAFGISPSSNTQIHGNRIFGGGYLAVGIATFGGTEKVHAHDNFILMQASEPQRRWPEYGPQSGAHGIRVQWGAQNATIENNVVIGRAREGGRSRALWVAPAARVSNIAFNNNTIQSVAQDQATDDVAAISITGENQTVGEHTPMIFRGNRIIANLINVRAGETYGGGSNGTRFIDNTFVRGEPLREDYHTIQIGFWTREIYDHHFIDNTFEAGASHDAFAFVGNDGTHRDFSVGHTVTIKTTPGATVLILDSQGDEVFNAPADESGLITLPLLQFRQTPEGRVELTPHTITVEAEQQKHTKTLTVNAAQKITLP